jgi:hypothetical protein
MGKNKAAGPDGMPIEFYQSCWEIVKEDIMAMFNDFYLGTKLWRNYSSSKSQGCCKKINNLGPFAFLTAYTNGIPRPGLEPRSLLMAG